MKTILNNEIECIQDVVIEGSHDVAFTKGNKYKANTQVMHLKALNNFGDIHELGMRYDEDRFFLNHFKQVK